MKKLILLSLFTCFALYPALSLAQVMGSDYNSAVVGGGKYRLNPYGSPYGGAYPGGYPVAPQNDPNTATVGRPYYYYGYPGPGYDPNFNGGIQSDGNSVWVPGR